MEYCKICKKSFSNSLKYCPECKNQLYKEYLNGIMYLNKNGRIQIKDNYSRKYSKNIISHDLIKINKKFIDELKKVSNKIVLIINEANDKRPISLKFIINNYCFYIDNLETSEINTFILEGIIVDKALKDIINQGSNLSNRAKLLLKLKGD